jgi:hypothetical protein
MFHSQALAAFEQLKKRPSPDGWVFVTIQGERLCGYKHWFDPAVKGRQGFAISRGTASGHLRQSAGHGKG